MVFAPTERAWPSWLSRRRQQGHIHGQTCEGGLRQTLPLPNPSLLHNLEPGQGQPSDAPNGVAPVWCATGARGWLPRHRRRSLRTSGSVGRAPGNRCLYPEADTGERGSCVAGATLYRSPVRLRPSVGLHTLGWKIKATWEQKQEQRRGGHVCNVQ